MKTEPIVKHIVLRSQGEDFEGDDREEKHFYLKKGDRILLILPYAKRGVIYPSV